MTLPLITMAQIGPPQGMIDARWTKSIVKEFLQEREVNTHNATKLFIKALIANFLKMSPQVRLNYYLPKIVLKNSNAILK
jgi:hypothetical protein